jgi:hypothetical protein
MTPDLPRAHRYPTRPLSLPTSDEHPRAYTRIGANALRAAHGAHKGSEHDGRVGYDCTTCRRYLTAITHTTAHEHAQQAAP